MHSSHPIAKSFIKELEEKAKLVRIGRNPRSQRTRYSSKVERDFYQFGSAKFVNHEEETHQIYLYKNNSFFAGINCSDELKKRD